MKRFHDVPASVLNLAEFVEQVEEHRKALDAIESSGAVLVEFEVEGDWFGSRWRRTREFRWMIYVQLWVSQSEWVDHVEGLVAQRSGRWARLQEPQVALSNAVRFARSHLARSASGGGSS